MSFALRPLPAQGGLLPGLVFEPRIPSALPLEIQLHPKVKLRIRAGTNVGTLFGLTIRPGQFALRYPFAPGTPPPTAGIGVGFDFTPAAPVVLLGDPKASRIEFASAALDFGADIGGSGVSLSLGADLNGLKVVIDAGDGDSFIKKIIGEGKTEVDDTARRSTGRRRAASASRAAPRSKSRCTRTCILGRSASTICDIKLSVPAGAPPQGNTRSRSRHLGRARPAEVHG